MGVEKLSRDVEWAAKIFPVKTHLTPLPAIINEQTYQSTVICLGYRNNCYCYVWRNEMSQIQLKTIKLLQILVLDSPYMPGQISRTNFPDTQPASQDRLHNICLRALDR